jgi:ABC-type polysaccharide/polyol phosphate transport system ATPase subunit
MSRPPGTIELIDLSKSFRHYRSQSVKEVLVHLARGERTVERRLILDRLNLRIAPGERVGVVGRNGAGKSTLFKILSGILVPDAGEAHVIGRVSPLIEVTAGFVPDMSGDENLRLNAAILGVSSKDLADRYRRIVAFAGLEDFMATPMRYYSSGMQTRLGFSVVAHVDAEILLIDEVLSVGDIEFQKKSLARMDEIAASGTTVVLVSHDFNAVKRFCTRAIWLDAGRVRLDDTPANVVQAIQADSERTPAVSP